MPRLYSHSEAGTLAGARTGSKQTKRSTHNCEQHNFGIEVQTTVNAKETIVQFVCITLPDAVYAN